MKIKTWYNNLTSVGKVMCFQMAINVGVIWYIVHVNKDLQTLWSVVTKTILLSYLK